ncbi:hypothetical protein Tco_0255423 [Tanacetum coccineum]
MTQSQLMKSTQGTHRTPSTPTPPNPVTTQGESSDPRKPTVIRFHMRSQPDPKKPILTAAEIDIDSLDEATRLSIATARSLEDLEAQKTVEKVQEHLVDEEIEDLVEGEPKSQKERSEVEKSDDVLIINDDEEEESTRDALIRKKGKGIVEIKDTPPPTPIRSPRTHTSPLSSDKKKLQELTASDSTPSSSKPTTSSSKLKPDCVKQYKSVFHKMSRRYGYMFRHLKTSVATVCTRDHEDHHDDDASPEGESNAKRQKISKHGTFTTGIDDDYEVPTKEVSLELLAEMSKRKMTFDDIQIMQNAINVMRDRCNSGEEHQYHLDQMKRYMENQIVWESREEDLTVQIPKKPGSVYLSCARNPKIPPMSLANQDLFCLKYGNLGTRKYIPSLHKIHVVPFPEDDLEELNTRWVKKIIKRFNHYARYVFDQGYGTEYMKEIVVKRANGEYLGFTESDYKYLYKNDIEDMYLMCINGIIKDYRQNGLLRSLILFIRSCVYWERVLDYQLGMESYQQKVNLTAPTLTFQGIKEEKLLTITSEPIAGLVYEYSKQEKRVMIIEEIPKLCDATLKRVFEKVKKFNLDVKHGYADPDLGNEDAKYMGFYEEYIKER